MWNKVVFRILAVVLGCFIQWTAGAQSVTLEVDKTYDFSPQKLSKKEKEKKMKAMDRFWNTVKSDTTVYLPLLRRELAAGGHVPFFYFDGSGLLLYLSHGRSDEQIAANAIVKSDIKDIDQQIYVRTLNQLAFDSIDVVPAALKILDYPDFKFFLVEHVMYFDLENSLAYSLLSLPTGMYLDSLISRFPSADTTAQFSILYTLWLGYSCRGDSMIQASAKNTGLYTGVRAFADTLASPHPGPDPEQSSLTIAELKERRRHGLRRFSDEGLADLLSYTMALRNRTTCGLNDEKDRIKTEDNSIEDSILNRIYHFPEVQAKQQFIDSLTRHKQGLSMMTLKHLDGTEPYYEVQVGYNGEMRFETYYIFYVYKKDMLIKYYDTVDGEVISLDEWRKRNKS